MRHVFKSRPGTEVLVSTPLTNFRKALEMLEKHSGRDYHKMAVVTMGSFASVMTGQQESVSVQLSDAAQELIVKSRKKLQSISNWLFSLRFTP